MRRLDRCSGEGTGSRGDGFRVRGRTGAVGLPVASDPTHGPILLPCHAPAVRWTADDGTNRRAPGVEIRPSTLVRPDDVVRPREAPGATRWETCVGRPVRQISDHPGGRLPGGAPEPGGEALSSSITVWVRACRPSGARHPSRSPARPRSRTLAEVSGWRAEPRVHDIATRSRTFTTVTSAPTRHGSTNRTLDRWRPTSNHAPRGANRRSPGLSAAFEVTLELPVGHGVVIEDDLLLPSHVDEVPEYIVSEGLPHHLALLHLGDRLVQ